jgi:hypothetical protein
VKIFYKILLLLLCFWLVLSLDVSAQVGEVGRPIVDIEFFAVCDDATTVYNMVQTVVGGSNPTSLGYVTASGGAHTLSGGTLTAGYCDGATGTADIDYTTTVQALCDDGTSFYRVSVFTRDTLAVTATQDYELDLATAYVVSGTVYSGPCYVARTASITRTVSSTNGNIAAGAFSYEICNSGTENGTVTIGAGIAGTLIPGSCISFAATYNPAARQYRIAPAISYFATGTTFTVVTEN